MSNDPHPHIKAAILRAINRYPDRVEQAQFNPALVGWFVGNVMADLNGGADAKEVERRLKVMLHLEIPPDRPVLSKRPVAWRVKDLADGWIIFQDEAKAYHEAEQTGALMQGLYVRDGQ